MRILIACEHSGTVRDAFLKKGHDAWSCDLLPTDVPGPHIQGDVLEILNDGWDMMIAHPECTYLANSGVQWLNKDPSRWSKMVKAGEFFKTLQTADIEKKVIENPIMHGYGKEAAGCGQQTQLIQPYHFGTPESKATCLWVEGLDKLEHTNNVKHIYDKLPKREQQKMFYLPPSPDRWKLRSKTYQCFADAFAEQWGRK